MNRLLGVFIIFTITLFSCKRNKIAQSIEPEDAAGKLAVQQIDFEYFSSKAKVDYSDGNSDLGFTATIRMKKDSIIWLSASPALGIEAARAVITVDSVKILNRLNSTYQQYSIDYLKKNFNVELSLSNLQNMLLGNLVVPKAKGDKLGTEEDNCTVLEQDNQRLKVRNFVNKENHKVSRLIVAEKNTDNQLNVVYSDFGMLEQYLFANKNVISANVKGQGQNKNIKITIEHNKTEISNKPLNFAFNVPKKYENK